MRIREEEMHSYMKQIKPTKWKKIPLLKIKYSPTDKYKDYFMH